MFYGKYGTSDKIKPLKKGRRKTITKSAELLKDKPSGKFGFFVERR
jgi:hypothetical protein